MGEILVRQLSDGEELVMEESPTSGLSDPRDRAMEIRRRALGDEESPEGSRA